MTDLTFHFRALDDAMIEEWEKYFGEFDNLIIARGDILAENAGAIVSPANSFGYMDGGLDLLYSLHFGWDLEKRVRKVLLDEHDGELPVGQAVREDRGWKIEDGG